MKRTVFTDNIDKKLKPGDWFLNEQSRINQFADVTEDHQYIHIDQQRAAESYLRGTIAHGFLVLSLLPKLIEKSLITPDNIVMGINYGFDKVRFINPVKCGDEIRFSGSIIAMEPRGEHQFLQKRAVTVEIKGQDKPALVCEWLVLYVCNEDSEG